MKHILGVIFFISFLHTLVGQELTYFYSRKLFNAPNACDISYTGCDWRPIANSSTNMLGYAHHPSGKLWLVLDELYDQDGYHRIKIFGTDIVNCKYKLLYSIDLPLYWSCGGAVNLDFQGHLYFSLDEWDAVNSTTIRTLSRIEDPANPIVERLLILAPGQQVGELLIQNQKVYLVEPNQAFIPC